LLPQFRLPIGARPRRVIQRDITHRDIGSCAVWPMVGKVTAWKDHVIGKKQL